MSDAYRLRDRAEETNKELQNAKKLTQALGLKPRLTLLEQRVAKLELAHVSTMRKLTRMLYHMLKTGESNTIEHRTADLEGRVAKLDGRIAQKQELEARITALEDRVTELEKDSKESTTT